MKTFKIAALIPHGNTQTRLQQEQNNLCSMSGLIKAVPFLCILEKLKDNTENNQILSKYSSFFQSLKCIPELSPVKIADFRAFRSLNKEISLYLSEETFKAGSFLYKSGELLYAESRIKAFDSNENDISSSVRPISEALPAENEKIQLKVFQIAVFSIEEKQNMLTWHAEAAKWIRCNKLS